MTSKCSHIVTGKQSHCNMSYPPLGSGEVDTNDPESPLMQNGTKAPVVEEEEIDEIRSVHDR